MTKQQECGAAVKDVAAKFGKLKNLISDMGSMVVAFSGGVDSSFLLGVASEVLGEKVMAVTVRSPIRPEKDLERAGNIAAFLGVKHMIVDADELSSDGGISDNPKDRCYICKKKIFSRLKVMSSEMGFLTVSEGSNADDSKDHRPGMRAVRELGVRSPLEEAGLSKPEIRTLSREMSLITWDLPSQSCFMTRFPYGVKVGKKDIAKVERAEDIIKGYGFSQVRVRVYGDMVRIELDPSEIPGLFKGGKAERIAGEIKETGYDHVTLDLEGYRTGSMDI